MNLRRGGTVEVASIHTLIEGRKEIAVFWTVEDVQTVPFGSDQGSGLGRPTGRRVFRGPRPRHDIADTPVESRKEVPLEHGCSIGDHSRSRAARLGPHRPPA